MSSERDQTFLRLLFNVRLEIISFDGKVTITREWLQSLDLFQVAFEQEGYIVPQAMVFRVSHLVIYVVKQGGTKDLF